MCPKSIRPAFISPRWCYSSSSRPRHSSKYFPFDWITRSQRCFHILKQSSNADFGMAFSSRVALLWTVSMSSNCFSLNAIFNFGNKQKSQGAMSGLYGGWRSCTIFCFAKNCCIRFNECAGALLWWRSQSPLDQKRGRFLLTALRNLFAKFSVHEQSIDDHLQYQVTHARCFPVLLSEKVGQNEGHCQLMCGHF